MSYPFIQAKYFHKGGNEDPTRIVLHRMESSLKGDTAENVARYFHDGPFYWRETKDAQGKVTGREKVAIPSSCHACVDNNSIVRCVKDEDRAFHAPPNAHSLGIEHAGRSAHDDWDTPYCQDMLRLSAKLCAEWCLKYNIPPVWLSHEDVKDGKKGITSHQNVSKAFGKSTHWDPGPRFPVECYLGMVKEAMLISHDLP